MTYTLPLVDAAGRSEDAGSKAETLATLARTGFPVPEGFVVTVRAFERFCTESGLAEDSLHESAKAAPIPEEVADEIRSASLCFTDGPVAVRSSGVAEDLPDASFAGQYETVLDVHGPDAILEAVRVCWASAFAARVLTYRTSIKKAGPPRMAVIVQRLVTAEAAGVAFSANPVTGDRNEVAVSAVRGLGERLVSGQATADEWNVREGRTECLRSPEGAITEEQVREIADLARRVELNYGAPQDIEWAFADGKLFLLQARPITALPEPVKWESGVSGAWLRNFRLGEWLGDPITPLFGTWLVDRLDNRMYGNFERVLRMPTTKPYHVIVNGWYYATGNFLPKNALHMLVLGIRYLLPGFLLRPRKMAMLTTSKTHWGIGWFEREWRVTIRPRYRALVTEAERRVEDARPQELLDLVDRLLDSAGDSFYSMIALGGSAWKPEYVLAGFYQKHVQPHVGGSHQELLQGLGGPRGGTSPNVISLDWTQPTLEELGTATHNAEDTYHRMRAIADRERAEASAREVLKDMPRRLRRFERILEQAQHAARVREEQTAELTLAWPVMRRALRKLGETLKAQGKLASGEDVFFLKKEELFDAVNRPEDDRQFRREVADRRAQWQRQRRLAPPLQLGKFPPIADRLLKRFERTLAGAQRRTEGFVRGLPASPGRATGPARLIRSPEEFNRLKPGDILVAPATNPAWTPLFALAAAVVTDTGSLMAHASLVAREYGIPAIVGTGDGTALLRDGQIVTVDGNRGTVDPL